MNDKAKTSIFFVILLLLISLIATGFYFISYEQEKKASQQLEQKLNAVTQDKDKIQKQLEMVIKEKMILETKVREGEKTISDLGQKLTLEIQTKESILQQQKSLQDKILQAEQEKKSIGDRLNEKLMELDKLQRQLKAIAFEKEKLEKAILSEEKENKGENLEKIVVSSPVSPEKNEQTQEAKPVLSAKVLLINKEYKFLILDVGMDNGVNIEDVFDVFHNDVSIGRVQVEKLHPNTSAAKFLEDFKLDQVSEGDTANRI